MPDTAPARVAGPNCFQCRHLAVSWDPQLPYACRLMGFKSKHLPAIEVLRADGLFCAGFSAKESAPAAMSGRSAHADLSGRAVQASPVPHVSASSTDAFIPHPGRQAPELEEPVLERADLRRLSTFRRPG